MRVILKKEKKRPRSPKTATMKALENYNKRLNEVEKYNNQVRAYNRALVAAAEKTIRRVAGFGSKGKSCKKGK